MVRHTGLTVSWCKPWWSRSITLVMMLPVDIWSRCEKNTSYDSSWIIYPLKCGPGCVYVCVCVCVCLNVCGKVSLHESLCVFCLCTSAFKALQAVSGWKSLKASGLKIVIHVFPFLSFFFLLFPVANGKLESIFTVLKTAMYFTYVLTDLNTRCLGLATAEWWQSKVTL